METADTPHPAAAGERSGASANLPYVLALSDAEVARYRAMAERARTAEADLWLRAGVVPGAQVVDVGCGPGALLPALPDAVTPTGRVTAIDADPAAVAAATALVGASALRNVAVHRGRAEQTGLPVGSYDVVMLRHVLAHNGGGEDTIVAHLASLLRPGGCLYLVDADGTVMRMVPEDADLQDLHDRYVTLHARRGNDVHAGLRPGERLVRAGLELMEFRGSYLIGPMPVGMRPPPWAAREAMVAAGVATPRDVARWASAFARFDAAANRPTLFAPMFAAVGRRPA
jgi:SAM-dependent methyltransferase